MGGGGGGGGGSPSRLFFSRSIFGRFESSFLQQSGSSKT